MQPRKALSSLGFRTASGDYGDVGLSFHELFV